MTQLSTYMDSGPRFDCVEMLIYSCARGEGEGEGGGS